VFNLHGGGVVWFVQRRERRASLAEREKEGETFLVWEIE